MTKVRALPVIQEFIELKTSVAKHLEKLVYEHPQVELKCFIDLSVNLYERVDALFDAHDETLTMERSESERLRNELSELTALFISLKKESAT